MGENLHSFNIAKLSLNAVYFKLLTANYCFHETEQIFISLQDNIQKMLQHGVNTQRLD